MNCAIFVVENVKMYMGKMRVKTDQAKIGLLYRAKWTLLGCTLDILPGKWKVVNYQQEILSVLILIVVNICMC